MYYIFYKNYDYIQWREDNSKAGIHDGTEESDFVNIELEAVEFMHDIMNTIVNNRDHTNFDKKTRNNAPCEPELFKEAICFFR